MEPRHGGLFVTAAGYGVPVSGVATITDTERPVIVLSMGEWARTRVWRARRAWEYVWAWGWCGDGEVE